MKQLIKLRHSFGRIAILCFVIAILASMLLSCAFYRTFPKYCCSVAGGGAIAAKLDGGYSVDEIRIAIGHTNRKGIDHAWLEVRDKGDWLPVTDMGFVCEVGNASVTHGYDAYKYLSFEEFMKDLNMIR
jgi:hypothetical protein